MTYSSQHFDRWYSSFDHFPDDVFRNGCANQNRCISQTLCSARIGDRNSLVWDYISSRKLLETAQLDAVISTTCNHYMIKRSEPLISKHCSSQTRPKPHSWQHYLQLQFPSFQRLNTKPWSWFTIWTRSDERSMSLHFSWNWKGKKSAILLTLLIWSFQWRRYWVQLLFWLSCSFKI